MEFLRSLVQGAVLTWRHLPEVIAVNLLWLAFSWTLVGFGPATLAAYHWLARHARDAKELRLKEFFPLLLRHLWAGVGWALALLLLLALAYANLAFWPRVLPPFALAVVQVFWWYVLALWLALQPYVLESLTLEPGPLPSRLFVALARFFREPLTAHARVLVPVTVLWVGLQFKTLIPLVLVGVILLFMTVSVKPMYVPPQPREEEVA